MAIDYKYVPFQYGSKSATPTYDFTKTPENNTNAQRYPALYTPAPSTVTTPLPSVSAKPVTQSSTNAGNLTAPYTQGMAPQPEAKPDPLTELKNQMAGISKQLADSQKANVDYQTKVDSLTSQLPTRNYENESQSLQASMNAMLAARQAEINRAKQRVVSAQNEIITNAPQEFQSYRNQADVNGAQNVQALKNMLANLGQSRGGFGLTAMSKANANTANQIANFNQQQENTINTARRNIADAEASAGFDEIQTAQTLSANLLNQLANLKKDVSESEYRKISDTLNQYYNVNRAINSDNQFAAQFGASNANNLFNSGINLANTTGYLPNGTQTLEKQNQSFNQGIATRQQNNNDMTSNAQVTGINIDNQYRPAQYQADITGKSLSNIGQRLNNQGQEITNEQGQKYLDSYDTILGQQIQKGNLDNQGMDLQNKTAQYTYDNVLPMQLDQMKKALEKGDAETAYQLLVNKMYPAVMEANIRQSDASANASNASAYRAYNPVSTAKEKAAPEKSPYFERYSDMIANRIEGFGNYYNAASNKWEPIAGSGQPDYARQIGSVEHKAIVKDIMRADITPTERQLLFNEHNIPWHKYD